MIVVRPGKVADVTSIEQLLTRLPVRVSTLPENRDKIAERLMRSEESFAGTLIDDSRSYLFVMEDTSCGRILGTAAIDACAGHGFPFVSYRKDSILQASHALDVRSRIPVLFLSHELTANTLLCSFAIDPEYRQSEYFDLLSRSRLLFIAQHPELFAEQIVVELQGVLDDEGQSPFWDSVGRHFFGIDFATADYYSGVKSKTFVAELMPHHPIYVNLLSEQAQQCLGIYHPKIEPTAQLLFREGLKASQFLDIFDGGPVLTALTSEIQTIQNSRRKSLKVGSSHGGLRYLVSNLKERQFRASIAQVVDGLGQSIRLDSEVTELLMLGEDDQLLLSPL